MAITHTHSLTIAFSDDVEVKVCILWVAAVELLYHGPKFSTDGSLVGDVAERVSDVGEPGASWLVYEQEVGKGVPA